jgi:hypothetical protein
MFYAVSKGSAKECKRDVYDIHQCVVTQSEGTSFSPCFEDHIVVRGALRQGIAS